MFGQVGEPAGSLILKLLIVIVDEDRSEKVISFLRERHVRIQYACAGRGTANSEILDMLGLDGTDKAMLFILLPDFHANALLKIMPNQLDLDKHGHGIAFTIPLSGICRPVINIFSEEFMEKVKNYMESETDRINDEVVRHDLIVAVVNQGNSEELMEAVKEAGARGGTVVHARRTGLEEASSFFGMQVQTQKEIVMILTERKQKMAIMKVINHDFGIASEARGIIFSVPVDSVAGLHALS